MQSNDDTNLLHDLIDLCRYEQFNIYWFVHGYITSNENVKFHQKIVMRFPHVFLCIDLVSKCFVKLFSYLFNHSNCANILITDQNLEWKVVTDFSGRKNKSDAFFYTIITKLKNERLEMAGVYPIITKFNFKEIIENIKISIEKRSWFVNHIPFEKFWYLRIWCKKYEAFKYFKEKYRIFEKYANSIKISKGIKEKIKYSFLVIFPQIAEYLEISKNIINDLKPKVVLLQNEYGFFERSLIAVCKLKGIPTIAIQHGVIHPNHRGYIYPKEAKGQVIIPDVTCVYGKYHFRLLTKKSIYSPSQVIVTGQPRYDIFVALDKLYSKEKFIEKFGIPSHKKIVLWATQTHGLNMDENIKNLDTVLRCAKELEDKIVLIIKQHPGEEKEHTELIKKYIKKHKCENVILMPKDYDTYELLYIADLVIVRHSTVGMEAVALNKPLIVLNLSGEPDPVDYVEKGVAVGVYDANNLKPAIEKLLNDDSCIAKNREHYVKEYLYRIDGKASERVVNIIKMMLRKKT